MGSRTRIAREKKQASGISVSERLLKTIQEALVASRRLETAAANPPKETDASKKETTRKARLRSATGKRADISGPRPSDVAVAVIQ
jgi:hypothetical protein